MLTEEQWDEAHRKRTRVDQVIGVIGMLGVGVLTLAGMVLAMTLGQGIARYVIGPAVAMGLGAPLASLMLHVAEKKAVESEQSLRRMSHQLNDAVARAEKEAARRDAQARRQEFESRLANALDMANGEPEVLDVVERSLATVLPGASAELLLADNSHAHLVRMVSVGYESSGDGCQVDSPAQCPAARRAQVQVFADSSQLDACPKLRHRGDGDLGGLCVPMSIMGRTVGVLHSTAAPPLRPSEEQVNQLTTLAKLAGARIGMLRAMAESELQAASDSLTGLLNRRSFEQKVTEARRSHTVMTMAMADLDQFKLLNDTYGHETGDRALRLFSRVLRESLRGEDLLCRFGGEEFAVALPSCSAQDAIRALESLRARLDAAITVSGLPRFTASFGVAEMLSQDDLASALGRADTALFAAKRQGCDRVVANHVAPAEGPLGLRARELDHSSAPEEATALDHSVGNGPPSSST